ncbi:hypothetical protein EVAR_66970_1 [Eumeta japonica]|uniref:Uncharacterized protein n=1 Tax=Eumeta variegata TaxID=151549 RepID=A0A4C2A0Z5_EUMVA|nr:hypothetical protein EVAR_66970_1 [Eumeta japonica]
MEVKTDRRAKLRAGTGTETENGTEFEIKFGTGFRIKIVIWIEIKDSTGKGNRKHCRNQKRGTTLGLTERYINIKNEKIDYMSSKRSRDRKSSFI